jgi:hypothetical protein
MPYGVVVAICPFDLAHVVARQQHGQAARGEALDQGAHVADAGRVEAVGGLVEHQQARVAQQRGRDAETLAHTERVAAHLVALAAAQVDGFEDLVDARAAGAAVEAGEQLQGFVAAEPGVELRALDEPGDPVQRPHAVAGPRAPEHAQLAGIGPDQPEQHPQEGRLPGPVRAQHPVHLTLADLKAEPVDRGERAVGFRQADRVDREHITHEPSR